MGFKSAIFGGLVIASLGAVSVPAHVEAKSAQREFSDAWKARDERYTADGERLEARLKLALSELSSGPKYPEGIDRLHATYIAIDALANLQGKQSMLGAFRAFMGERPSSERTQFWFQEQEARLRDAVQSSNTQLETVVPRQRQWHRFEVVI